MALKWYQDKGVQMQMAKDSDTQNGGLWIYKRIQVTEDDQHTIASFSSIGLPLDHNHI